MYAGSARPVLAVGPIDFGIVQVGNTFDLTSTVTNQGLSGFVITSIAASGAGFAVVGENCPDVLHRGQSCAVTVRYSPAAAVVSTGQLTVRDDTYAPVPLAYSGALRGSGSAVAVTTTLPPAVTTTTAPSTPDAVRAGDRTGGDRVPGADGRGRRGHPDGAGAQHRHGPQHGERGVDRRHQRGRLRRRARRTASARRSRPSATCDVEVGFTPTDAGVRAAQLTATGQGGSSASATLTGAALYVPTLEAFPPVAAPGQVTTLIGEGFPPSTPIQMVWEAVPRCSRSRATRPGRSSSRC